MNYTHETTHYLGFSGHEAPPELEHLIVGGASFAFDKILLVGTRGESPEVDDTPIWVVQVKPTNDDTQIKIGVQVIDLDHTHRTIGEYVINSDELTEQDIDGEVNILHVEANHCIIQLRVDDNPQASAVLLCTTEACYPIGVSEETLTLLSVADQAFLHFVSKEAALRVSGGEEDAEFFVLGVHSYADDSDSRDVGVASVMMGVFTKDVKTLIALEDFEVDAGAVCEMTFEEGDQSADVIFSMAKHPFNTERSNGLVERFVRLRLGD